MTGISVTISPNESFIKEVSTRSFSHIARDQLSAHDDETSTWSCWISSIVDCQWILVLPVSRPRERRLARSGRRCRLPDAGCFARGLTLCS